MMAYGALISTRIASALLMMEDGLVACLKVLVKQNKERTAGRKSKGGDDSAEAAAGPNGGAEGQDRSLAVPRWIAAWLRCEYSQGYSILCGDSCDN